MCSEPVAADAEKKPKSQEWCKEANKSDRRILRQGEPHHDTRPEENWHQQKEPAVVDLVLASAHHHLRKRLSLCAHWQKTARYPGRKEGTPRGREQERFTLKTRHKRALRLPSICQGALT